MRITTFKVAAFALFSVSALQVPQTLAAAPSQQPLFLGQSAPPLMMLVMQRDHKLYYEAYNDASDLDEDGGLDIGFKPSMEYLGYFDSNLCYEYVSNRFEPKAKATNMKCSGQWAGNFLNYQTTSRMDALRRVLYGGMRYTDTTTDTALQRAFIPQDAHSWGKEYNSETIDGYKISDYTPLSAPSSGKRHLFANTTLSGATPPNPLLRVLVNSTDHFYNWVSKEQPVAGDSCATGGNSTHTCTGTRTDYIVRVQVCVSGLLDSVCTLYPNGKYKPTGLLQKYGANGTMHFGLLTGSYQKNLSGGVLRKNIGAFTDEINSGTGQFLLTGDNDEGIVNTTNKLAATGFSGYTYTCGWITGAPLASGQCQMWGNPIGEMMYEAVRYFAGSTATPDFLVAKNAGEESTLKLPVATWKDPYKSIANGGSGEKVCSKPFMMVISDINPSYDSDEIPGSAFKTSAFAGSLSTLDVSAEANKIWSSEGITAGNYFIGQSGSVSDNAPTAKAVSGFGNIRGLAPEEPTKQGSYYSAAVSEWARVHDVNAVTGDQKIKTFSVVMASPLPRVTIPVNGKNITIIPFAKSVGGSGISATTGSFQPTNQLVDYYITKIKNTDSSNADTATNGGRPYYEFRINFEDVEQGADHDMDAIVLYKVYLNADNSSITVDLDSDYAAGGIIQHMGYVVSGSTADNVYLVVRDYDTASGSDPNYYLDTPQHSGSALPLTSVRTFSPGSSSAAFLPHDPLWYAAKWGGFKDGKTGTADVIDSQDEWDADHNGTPDNYYLVTNPAKLYEQLDKAFNDVLSDATTFTAYSSNSTQLKTTTNVYKASFSSTDWSGDLEAYAIDAKGKLGAQVWSAAAHIPTETTRNVYTWKLYKGAATTYTASGVGFDYANLSPDQLSILGQASAFGTTTVTATNQTNLIKYIRGDQLNEGTSYRARTSKMGDVVDSDPTYGGNVDFGYDRMQGSEGGSTKYLTYLKNKAAGPQTVYVGANDGMLHAVNAATGAERFTFIPNDVITNLKYLASTDYASSHRFYVDGGLHYADAYLTLPGSTAAKSWKSFLVGTTGAGGHSVFALNVTDVSSFSASDVRWEFTHADLGYTMSKPVVTKMPNGRWAVVTGNGPESSSGTSKLFIIYLDAVLNDATGWDANQDYCVLSTDTDTGAGLSTPTVVLDANGVAQQIYAGDIKGRMWRFNVAGTTTNACPSTWTASKVFTATNAANSAQPITAAPDIEIGPSGGYMVLFGTGRYYQSTDTTDLAIQSLYGVLDPLTAADPAITRSSLVEQKITKQSSGTVTSGSNSYTWTARSTSSNAVDFATKKGWFLDLVDMSSGTASAAGERTLSMPVVFGNNVLFTTYVPSTDSCSSGGSSWTFALDYRTGASLSTSYFDLNYDSAFDINDQIPGLGVASAIQYGNSGSSPSFFSSGSSKFLVKEGGAPNPPPQVQSGRLMASWRQIK